MAGRTGWHGIDTTDGRRLVYLFRHCTVSYFIDLEFARKGDALTYMLAGCMDEVNLGSQIKPLSVLKMMLQNTLVRGVFIAEVKGDPAPGVSGICITCLMGGGEDHHAFAIAGHGGRGVGGG